MSSYTQFNRHRCVVYIYISKYLGASEQPTVPTKLRNLLINPSISLSVYLPAPLCLPVRPPVPLPVCVDVWIPAGLSVYVRLPNLFDLSTCLSVFLSELYL